MAARPPRATFVLTELAEPFTILAADQRPEEEQNRRVGARLGADRGWSNWDQEVVTELVADGLVLVRVLVMRGALRWKNASAQLRNGLAGETRVQTDTDPASPPR